MRDYLGPWSKTKLTLNISRIIVSRNSLLGAGQAHFSLTDAVAGRENVSLVDQGTSAQQLLPFEPDPRHPGFVLLHGVTVHNPVVVLRRTPLVPPPVILLPLGGVVLLHLGTATPSPR